MAEPTITHVLLRIMRLFLLCSPRKLSGYAIAKDLRADTGTVWAALRRMQDCGWLVSRMEEIRPDIVGRPARRLYELTKPGAKRSRELLDELQLPPRKDG